MDLFYEIVQVALQLRSSLSHAPSDLEWNFLFEESQQQAIAGIIFDTLEILSEKGQKPPLPLLYEWIGLSEQIKKQNKIVNKRCKNITTIFAEAGFDTCILKGQGNALMYPNPLSRMSGDIDIWVWGNRDAITKFVRSKTPDVLELEHHIDFPIFEDVAVEVHYVPSVLFTPIYNRRFQKWSSEQIDYIKKNGNITQYGYIIPSVSFNAIFQMAHIYIHFFIEGIGMRHFVDYYYVLRGLKSTDKFQVVENIRKFGLERFACGVMWIEKYCLGIGDEYLLFEPSEIIGKLIQKEMEKGGNFGQYDSRFTMRNKGFLARGAADIARLFSLAYVFPSECFWKVIEKITNQRWKFKKNSI